MIAKLLSFTCVLVAAMQLQHSSCQKTKTSSSSLLPLVVGNQWVYRDSVFENGKVSSVSMDTLVIIGTSNFEGKTTYIFSDGRELLLKGDSLFQVVQQRNATKFLTPLFIPTETQTTFHYAFGGDVVKQQTVTLLNNCPKIPWKASKCFRVEDVCHSQFILAYGVGIVREKITDCSTAGKIYTTKTLVAVKFQK